MTKKLILSIVVALFSVFSLTGKTYSVQSPSKVLRLELSVADSTRYSIYVDGKPVISNSTIALVLNDGRVFGAKPSVKKAVKSSKSGVIKSPFYRKSQIEENYNAVTLTFKDGWGIDLRAYDDGVAYRFFSLQKKDFIVEDEIFNIDFTDKYEVAVPYVKRKEYVYECSFETEYLWGRVGENLLSYKRPFSYFPLFVRLDKGAMVLTESNLEEYPGVFLKEKSTGYMAEFPPVRNEVRLSDRHMEMPVNNMGYIAKVAGTRTFPWRLFAWAEDEKNLAVNDMVYKTADDCRLADISWIQPGKSSWDWWNDYMLTGVDFPAKISTDYYKYAIDFAAEYGLTFTTIDEGWYEDLNPMKISRNVNLQYLCEYAESKGVKLMLWTVGSLMYNNLETLCKTYSEMGISGFKVDFFDSQDQDVSHMLYTIAAKAAEYGLFIDYHGIHKPTGLQRTYPNVLNYEAVFGLEQSKFNRHDYNMVKHDVSIPFIRQVAGPMDYTPGALRNVTKESFRMNNEEPQSQGTRAHQVATYVVFEAPASMLCDSPSEYRRDDYTARFISRLPSVSDDTFIADGKVGEYIVTVREKDGKWYVGALTDWTPRSLNLPLSFLGDGEYTASIFRDGINSSKSPTDFAVEEINVSSSDTIEINMAPGGGWCAIFAK